MRSTEPTSTARWTLWMASNSAASSPSFSDRTSDQRASRSSRRRSRSAPSAARIRSSSPATRASSRVRTSTSRANTTAAAGAPPMTEACAPSSAIVSSPGLSRREKTTNAPPWKREITQKAIGPSKFTIARPISAPYSSCSRRIDSGEPSKPARLASTTRGRRPEAALIARAIFFDACGNRVPEVQPSGPSAGTAP